MTKRVLAALLIAVALVAGAIASYRSATATPAPARDSSIQFDLDSGGGATPQSTATSQAPPSRRPTATPVPTATSVPPAAKYAVIFVLDGARPDYFTVPGIPHIRALMEHGTVYTNAFAGVLQSETPTGHAAIGSGELPRNNGIQGFGWQVPSGSYVSVFNPAYIQDHTMENLMSSAPSLAGILHRAKPGSRVAALGSYKYYANDALGGPAADYTMYYAPGPKDDYRPVSVAGHVPPQSLLTRKDLIYPTYKNVPLGVSDRLAMELARDTFERTRSNVIMLNVPEFDQPLGHIWGANRDMKDATRLMQQFDASLGTIEDAYRKAGVLDQTAFIITADHGFQAYDRLVTPDVINNAVASAGLKVTHAAYHTADYLWLDHSVLAGSAAAAISELQNQNIQAVYYKEQTPPDYSYIRASGPDLFRVPGMEQANQLLLDSFVGPNSPDVVVMFRDGTAGDYTENQWKGDHGGADWESQHIPLIISGAGVRSGVVSSYPARLIDVAPTVLSLLGAPWNQMDGTALADALVTPPAGAAGVQAARGPALAADVRAMSSEAAKERAASLAAR